MLRMSVLLRSLCHVPLLAASVAWAVSVDVGTSNAIYTAAEFGQASTLRFVTGSRAELSFVDDAEVFATVRGPGDVRLRIDGAAVRFSGRLESADGDRSSTHLKLTGGARLFVAEHARINQQMANAIDARDIIVSGGGPQDVLELSPGFVADRSGFPDMDAWSANGFSALVCKNVHLVTHNSASLPSMHKRSESGHHSHQGVLSFAAGTNSQWSVRSEPQVYEGRFDWGAGTTLYTEHDLVCAGHYIDDARCYFGSSGAAPAELRKKGPATLALLGSQAYGPGSVIVVSEGKVAFYSDPSDPGAFMRATVDDNRWGTNLTLRVASGATAELRAPRRASLAGLVCDGTLRIVPDAVHGPPTTYVAGDLRFGKDAHIDLHVPADWAVGAQAPIRVAGNVTLGGSLRLPPEWPSTPGRYPIVVADGEISGTWALPSMPEGLQGVLERGVLVATERVPDEAGAEEGEPE